MGHNDATPTMHSSKELWDRMWRSRSTEEADDRRVIEEEMHSVRWRRLASWFRKYLPPYERLRTVELGSGRGEMSVLLAREGAQVTLIDQSSAALEAGRLLYRRWGCEVATQEGDLFQLDASLRSRFDLAMSFGVVEHFRYPKRQQIIEIHAEVVRPGGWIVVEAPNAWCVPYWPFRALASLTGHWKVGYERPFTGPELWRCAKRAGLVPRAIIGSAMIRDWLEFLFLRVLEHAARDRFRINRRWLEIPTPLDTWLSRSVILVAQVPENGRATAGPDQAGGMER